MFTTTTTDSTTMPRRRPDDERRVREIARARRVQRAMMPGSLPAPPHLRLATHMRTASEVGGDYYDACLAADGTLTVGLGDATGHGLDAGMMVAATKSLFTVYAGLPGSDRVMRQMHEAFRRMDIRGLYMAMQILKIRGDEVECCSAGMPPILHYHAATRSIERIVMKSPPLGTGFGHVFAARRMRLRPGDTLLLMTDGFSERFNARGELLGIERAEAVLRRLHGRSPDDIIRGLLHAAAGWSRGAASRRDDDMTFVVIQHR